MLLTRGELVRDGHPVELPDAIRHATLFPQSDLPEWPPGHPTRCIEIEGVHVLLPDGLPWALVLPEHIEESRTEDVTEAVRQRVRADERERAMWFVPEAASPDDLAQRLQTLGMRPTDLPGADPRAAQMVCVEAPPPGPEDLVARPAATVEEYLAAQLVVVDALGMDAAIRQAAEERAERLWPFQSQEGGLKAFVALVGGEVVAFAGACFGRTTVYLAGGATRPDYRGRGAYRALVRARWDAAVERGTPVLTVGAGEMSRPILERLGFSTVGWEDCLLDPLD
jgi:GNAT superfamily N-acetyltransferase